MKSTLLPNLQIDIGWIASVRAMEQELIAGDYAKRIGLRVVQIKQKFGMLRVYLTTNSDGPLRDEIEKIVDRCVNLCLQTCETCGAVGENPEGVRRRYVNEWLRCVCYKCAVSLGAEDERDVRKNRTTGV
jgi:hypothetical protein